MKTDCLENPFEVRGQKQTRKSSKWKKNGWHKPITGCLWNTASGLAWSRPSPFYWNIDDQPKTNFQDKKTGNFIALDI